MINFTIKLGFQGAATGMILSHMIVLWIAVKSMMLPTDIKPDVPVLPTSIEGCTNSTFSPHISPILTSIINNSSYLTTDEATWDDDTINSLVDPEVLPTTHDV